ncbi:hypothetical protein [Cupriavidus plantarum]|uniref:hypothetical protein n=1 Tax=Cupriavidus plantarum TaxID=942865 RepID=UPI0015C9A76C|nr:hypothetical protein [Cupriavidus plantarum]NYH99965.1 hypothetical protein [Cupriavidus plantarum]
MAAASDYWHMWHLYSRGVIYCALGMPNVECTGMRWRDLQSYLPVRDRYAQTKMLQTTIAFMEIRGEIKVPVESDRMRLLYSKFLPWSAQFQLPASPSYAPAAVPETV